MKTHPTHKTVVSIDASSYDEICERCGATDGAGGTLDKPCSLILTCHVCNKPLAGVVVGNPCRQPSDPPSYVHPQCLTKAATEANERRNRLADAAPDLLAVLLAYEQWEASLILDDNSWRNGLPMLTQAQYDRLIELQGMRNAAVKKAKGAS